jgi:hypothetical protein
VRTVGGRLEAKTCGRFASYSDKNLDVPEIRVAFVCTPSIHGTLFVVNTFCLH